MLKTLIKSAHRKSRIRPTMVFTIGHSTRSIETFIDMLKAHGVQRLVDVRTIPRSRHNPQFNRDTLPETLLQAGIGYTHMEELGGLRHARKDSLGIAVEDIMSSTRTQSHELTSFAMVEGSHVTYPAAE